MLAACGMDIGAAVDELTGDRSGFPGAKVVRVHTEAAAGTAADPLYSHGLSNEPCRTLPPASAATARPTSFATPRLTPVPPILYTTAPPISSSADPTLFLSLTWPPQRRRDFRGPIELFADVA
ncbi:hypothetical protein HK405_015789 [Cladochytrium tenue]|nr:hypothetical protein HK405_015789 [Cladochytrium tenue]